MWAEQHLKEVEQPRAAFDQREDTRALTSATSL
jgi:hypothetical protein